MKTIINVTQNIDGSFTTYYSDGAVEITPHYPSAVNYITTSINITFETKECSVCNQMTEYQNIAERYNPIPNEPKLERIICNFCYAKAKDKYYGINRNVDNEKTLYGK